MMLTSIKITYPGKDFHALREDQQAYVQHLMLSWRGNFGPYSSVVLLKRAIKKTRNNLP